jgi:hypothetical protein
MIFNGPVSPFPFKDKHLVLIPEFLKFLVQIVYAALRITVSIRNHRKFEALVFLIQLVFLLIDKFKFFSQSYLNWVAFSEGNKFLLGKLKIFFYETLHFEKGTT